MKVIWDEKEPGWYWIDSQGKQGYFATCRSALEDYIAARECEISVEELAILVGVEDQV
jgi:hypothetical protein